MVLGVMEVVMLVQAVLYLGALLVGFAITWGKIKRITEDHERRIQSQENRLVQSNGSTAYITPGDCKEYRTERDKKIFSIEQVLTEHGKKIDGLIQDISGVKAKLSLNKRSSNGG